jgi:hypothetical protein
MLRFLAFASLAMNSDPLVEIRSGSVHQKWPIFPISALREKLAPQNINYMHPKGTSFGAPPG